MKRNSVIVIAAALLGLASGSAKADTIFDVEHARANERAGLVSEYDEELLERWGRLSGNYPPFRASLSPYERHRYIKRERRLRRW